MCSDVRECAAMLGSVQRSRLGSVQGGLRMCSEVWECMQECTATLESVQRGSRVCSGVCSNVKECAASFGACAASYESVQRG